MGTSAGLMNQRLLAQWRAVGARNASLRLFLVDWSVHILYTPLNRHTLNMMLFTYNEGILMGGETTGGREGDQGSAWHSCSRTWQADQFSRSGPAAGPSWA